MIIRPRVVSKALNATLSRSGCNHVSFWMMMDAGGSAIVVNAGILVCKCRGMESWIIHWLMLKERAWGDVRRKWMLSEFMESTRVGSSSKTTVPPTRNLEIPARLCSFGIEVWLGVWVNRKSLGCCLGGCGVGGRTSQRWTVEPIRIS